MESRKGKETREKEIGLAKRGAMMNEKNIGIMLKKSREKTCQGLNGKKILIGLKLSCWCAIV